MILDLKLQSNLAAMSVFRKLWQCVKCGSKSKYCNSLNSKFVYTYKKVLIKIYLCIIEHEHSRSSTQYLPVPFISLVRNLSHFFFFWTSFSLITNLTNSNVQGSSILRPVLVVTVTILFCSNYWSTFSSHICVFLAINSAQTFEVYPGRFPSFYMLWIFDILFEGI